MGAVTTAVWCALYDVPADANYELECVWCEKDPWLFELLVWVDDYVDLKMDLANKFI